MTPLFDPARHEALAGGPWDASRAREAIARIVAATEAAYVDGDRLWPIHPNDVEPGEPEFAPTPLYFGATGVVWALDYLRATGAATVSRDWGADLDALIDRNRAWLDACADAPLQDRASWLMGDLPLLMMQHARTPTPALEDQIAAIIASNIDHPARELMWGAPGSLLAAGFMVRRTGDARFAEAWRRLAARLWSQLERFDDPPCRAWSQDLYRKHSRYIDAAHGFAGTAFALIQGREWLDESQWRAWSDVIVDTVRATAVVRDGCANWPPQLGPVPTDRPMLMQHCHGSPGFVTCLSDLPDHSLDDLLLMAGEATWRAGPLVKGSNLCHGTGGNGHAFLKLYERTGDATWLERARAFAMHGIVQVERDAASFGQHRHSLWTGDPGFAIHLWDCIRARGRFPTMDVFDARFA